MTDEQNQTVLRAFAVAGNPAQAPATDEAFVASVAASVRRRRRLQWQLRLLVVGLLLVVAAVLAPVVAPAGVWVVEALLWLVTGATSLAASPEGIVTIAALTFSAGVVLWAIRRR
ncbi:MAG TPA: hypothetical protein VGO41_05925 [Steroidobacteraceae bacterium]|jgi:hypothetical protein|nr:hypothetical protein [Steroidobacteraceae bacterium]